jgi:hypothetical protein
MNKMKKEFNTTHGEFAFCLFPFNKQNDCEFTQTFICDYFFNIENKKLNLIGFVKDLSEEDWEEIVEQEIQTVKSSHIFLFNKEDDVYYYDYKNKSYTLETAKESGISLMNSLDVDNNENWFLIKYA